MMIMVDNDLTAMEVLMSTIRDRKSTVVSLVPFQRRAKRKSEKAGQKIKDTASDRGYATSSDYDKIIANPHLEKKFRENRKFLEGVFNAQSVNMITPHKVCKY